MDSSDLDIILDNLNSEHYNLVSNLEDALYLFGDDSEQVKAIEYELEQLDDEIKDIEEQIADRNYLDNEDLRNASYGW